MTRSRPVRRGSTGSSQGRPRRAPRHVAPEDDQLLVGDRHPLDRLAAFRLDHRSRDRIRGSGLRGRRRRPWRTPRRRRPPARTTPPGCGRGRSRAPPGSPRGRCCATRSRAGPSRAPGMGGRRAARPEARMRASRFRAPAGKGASRICRSSARRPRRRARARARRARFGARPGSVMSRSVRGTIRSTPCSATAAASAAT